MIICPYRYRPYAMLWEMFCSDRPQVIVQDLYIFFRVYCPINWYKSPHTFMSYNIFYDTLSMEEKFQYEKVHNKFCKSVLGLKKTACNIAAKSELGRFPLDSFIKIQVMMYFTRLHLSDINLLVQEAFNINKDLHDNGMYSWYTFATKIFEEFNFDFTEYENFNRPFYKKSLKKLSLRIILLKYKKSSLN